MSLTLDQPAHPLVYGCQCGQAKPQERDLVCQSCMEALPEALRNALARLDDPAVVSVPLVGIPWSPREALQQEALTYLIRIGRDAQ